MKVQNPDLPASAEAPYALHTEDQESRIRNFVLFGLVIWLLIAVTYKGAVSPASGIAGMDFHIFYQAAQRLNTGEPLYVPNTPSGLYVYAPLLAILLRPLAHLPFDAAMKAWFFVSAAALVLAVLLYGAAARLTWRSTPVFCLLLLVSFRFWDSTMDFGMGQTNFLILAMVAAILWANSRGMWVLFGLLVAAAALVKLWMLGLLLYPLLRRDARAVLVSLSAFALMQTALFCIVGWQEFPGYLRSMAVVKVRTEQGDVMNSVLGFAHLHLAQNTIVDPLLSSRPAYATFVAVCVAGLLWGFSVLWQVLKTPNLFQERLSIAVILASVLLLMPTYENGYFVYCLPLLWTLLTSLETDALPVSRVMMAGGVLVYLLFVRGWPVYAPFPPSLHHGLRSLIVSANFYGTVSLWGLGLYTLKKSQRMGIIQPGRDGIETSPGH